MVIGLALFVSTTPQAIAGNAAEQEALVEKARITFESFVADHDLSWFRNNVKKAKGILIYPQIIKGAFFIGGSGGSGILLVRDEKTGKWKIQGVWEFIMSVTLEFRKKKCFILILFRLTVDN